MLTAPSKPYDQMTEEERRQWKEWLLEQGKNPRPMVVDRPKSGSVFEYDYHLRAVIETALDGSHYLVEVRDGKIARARKVTQELPASNGPATRPDESPAGFALFLLGIIFAGIVLMQGLNPTGVRFHSNDYTQTSTSNPQHK